MAKLFYYLRVVTAVILIICVVYDFYDKLRQQAGALLDGPLGHYVFYTFALNKILLAALLSIVLLFDFKIPLPYWRRILFRVVGLLSVGLSIVGFGFIVRQQMFMVGMMAPEDIATSIRLIAELYLFQTAYLLISIIILSKSFEEKTNG